MNTKTQKQTHLKTTYLCNLRNLWFRIFQNKANLLEAGSRQLEAFPPNEPNFTLHLALLPFAISLFTFLLIVNRMGILYNFPQSRKRYYSGSIRIEPGEGRE